MDKTPEEFREALSGLIQARKEGRLKVVCGLTKAKLKRKRRDRARYLRQRNDRLRKYREKQTDEATN